MLDEWQKWRPQLNRHASPFKLFIKGRTLQVGGARAAKRIFDKFTECFCLGGESSHLDFEPLAREWQKWRPQLDGQPRPQLKKQVGTSKLCEFSEDDEDEDALWVNGKDKSEIYPEAPTAKKSEISDILEWCKHFSTQTPNLALSSG